MVQESKKGYIGSCRIRRGLSEARSHSLAEATQDTRLLVILITLRRLIRDIPATIHLQVMQGAVGWKRNFQKRSRVETDPSHPSSLAIRILQ